MGNRPRQINSLDVLLGVGLIGLAILLFLALVSYAPEQVPGWVPLVSTSTNTEAVPNLCGIFGAILSGYLYFLFGAAAYLWIIVAAGYGIAKLTIPRFQLAERVAWSIVMVVCGASLIQLQSWFFQTWGTDFHIEGPGGWVGRWVGEKGFGQALGSAGAPIVLAVFYLVSLVLAIGFHPIEVTRKLAAHVLGLIREPKPSDDPSPEAQGAEEIPPAPKKSRKPRGKKAADSPPDEEPQIIDATAPSVRKKAAKPEKESKEAPQLSMEGLELDNYQLPPLDLLDEVPTDERGSTDHEELRAIQATIIETLREFGIDAHPGNITFGPTITRYEVKPVKGVRVDRIASLERDIARATRAARINILAPIPGKDTVGIEIANTKKVKVTLRELLETDEWVESDRKLPLALGKDVYGKTIVADLGKMPHGLVAGTTGSGKSVCINSIIASLLFRFTPEELRFIMIDPKVVEMQIYNKLPHLVTPVVTESKKVLMALKWVIDEMEQRYKVFAKVGVRNIGAFNERPEAQPASKASTEDNPPVSIEADAPPEGEAPSPQEEPEEQEDVPKQPTRNLRDDDIIIPKTMPYIVVIIDELADLMQTAPADVESAIARITQMARAAGIHLLVATQTPRADVITGVINANIPSRSAFQVASGLDSRVILDQKGAEKLLGQGDMMYLPPGSSELTRAQGVLVTDEEIHRLVEYVAAQAEPKFESSIHEKLQAEDTGEDDVTDEDEELLDRCLDIMKQERRASTSMFQRRLRLGYSRAARIVDIMERRGLIGPVNGSRDREILIDLETL